MVHSNKVLVGLLASLAFVVAEDYVCPAGQSSTSVSVGAGDAMSFFTNEAGDKYTGNVNCKVTYEMADTCKQLLFDCEEFSLGKGDFLAVSRQTKKGVKTKKFKNKKFKVQKSNGDISVLFKSNKKKNGDGAFCYVECSKAAPGVTTTTSGPGSSSTEAPTTTTSVLDRVSLAAYPLAQCNNGNPAVYYKPKDPTGPKKALIYLQGGGLCFPSDEGSRNCDKRCENKPYQCAAKNDTTMDLRENKFYNSIFNEGQDRNPAFYDFAKIYVPYCTSDLHSGTREASSATKGRVFYGKHVVEAVIDDLIANSWIKEAEKVVMIGTSAGGHGVARNCDMMADKLKASATNANMDIKCVPDGAFDPQTAAVQEIDCEGGEDSWNMYDEHNAVPDQSCLDEAPDRNPCLRLADSWSYISTPSMPLTSSTDEVAVNGVCSACGADQCDQNFGQMWRDKIDEIARQMITAKPSWGVSIINCPFHVITSGVHYDYNVSVVDGAPGEKLTTGELLANFVNDSGPKQAIDPMDSLNPEC